MKQCSGLRKIFFRGASEYSKFFFRAAREKLNLLFVVLGATAKNLSRCARNLNDYLKRCVCESFFSFALRAKKVISRYQIFLLAGSM